MRSSLCHPCRNLLWFTLTLPVHFWRAADFLVVPSAFGFGYELEDAETCQDHLERRPVTVDAS